MSIRALYSIIQYIPDSSRGEAANVGVLLFVPSQPWLEVRMSSTLDRVRHFFRPGRQEIRRIELAIEALSHRMSLAPSQFSSESDLVSFVSTRTDELRLTMPRVATTLDPQADIESLYDELVGEHSNPHRAIRSSSTLPQEIAEAFGRLEAQKKIWRPGRIVLPTTNRSFDVPVAYRNGRVNFIRPESLASNTKIDSRLEKLGFSGRLIYRHKIADESSQLVVLSTDPDADPQIELKFARTLTDFDVRFIPHEESRRFTDEIETTAH